MKTADYTISWDDAIFVGTFGSLIVWASIALGFITADLFGIL